MRFSSLKGTAFAQFVELVRNLVFILVFASNALIACLNNCVFKVLGTCRPHTTARIGKVLRIMHLQYIYAIIL